MSKIKNSGLDQYGAEPLEQQQFGTAGVEGVNGPRTCRLDFVISQHVIHGGSGQRSMPRVVLGDNSRSFASVDGCKSYALSA